MHIENKKDLRVKMKAELQRNPEKEKKDMLIYNVLCDLDIYKDVKNIFSYVSFDGEVDTHNIILDALYKEIGVFVPKIINDSIFEVVKLNDFSELKKDKFGILAPVNSDKIDSVKFNLLLIPGLAFDKKMNRLGRGKGYFDRFLNEVTGVKIGLCYDFQIVDKVPIADNDVKMDIIVCDSGVIYP